VCGRTYSFISATSFPTSEGMAPLIWLLSRNLPNTQTRQSTTSVGSWAEGEMVMYVQKLHVHQLPNLRRDGADDGVAGQDPAKHPNTSAPRLVGAGWRVKWSMYVQKLHVHHVPNLRRDGAGDGVAVQVPAKHSPTSAPRLVGAGWRVRVSRTYSFVSATSVPTSDGMAPVMVLSFRSLPNTHPRQHHVWWELGGGCVCGRTYSSVSATSCPMVVGIVPLMELSPRTLHHPQPSSRSVGTARYRLAHAAQGGFGDAQLGAG
jgi:diadenosine tetraphosphate (Ap4A) HIT family hydrolase